MILLESRFLRVETTNKLKRFVVAGYIIPPFVLVNPSTLRVSARLCRRHLLLPNSLVVPRHNEESPPFTNFDRNRLSGEETKKLAPMRWRIEGGERESLGGHLQRMQR